jgi:hypothetical protein
VPDDDEETTVRGTRPAIPLRERAFAQARPGTRIELIPGAAHLANFDAPAAVPDAERRFARQLSPAA